MEVLKYSMSKWQSTAALAVICCNALSCMFAYPLPFKENTLAGFCCRSSLKVLLLFILRPAKSSIYCVDIFCYPETVPSFGELFSNNSYLVKLKACTLPHLNKAAAQWWTTIKCYRSIGLPSTKTFPDGPAVTVNNKWFATCCTFIIIHPYPFCRISFFLFKNVATFFNKQLLVGQSLVAPLCFKHKGRDSVSVYHRTDDGQEATRQLTRMSVWMWEEGILVLLI